jgi:hypothetical protein
MDTPREEFYNKPETEVWIAFNGREPGTKNRLHRERHAWGSCAALKSLGYGHAVLVVCAGGAGELTR